MLAVFFEEPQLTGLEPLDCIDDTISPLKLHFSISSSCVCAWFCECYFYPDVAIAKLPFAT